jgi:DNA-binding beta-propeller fold protein YncE
MRRAAILFTLLGALLHAQPQTNPVPTELVGKIFVAALWNVDGESDRPALAVDVKAGQLWIAHSGSVQVVDIETGKVINVITGFNQAHGLAFDDVGQFAYISDWRGYGPVWGPGGNSKPEGEVKVIDRRGLQVAATIPIKDAPKGVAFDPESGLLFVIPEPAPEYDRNHNLIQPDSLLNVTSRSSPVDAHKAFVERKSTLTVIDTEKQKVIGRVLITGRIDSAESDRAGTLYITVSDRSRLLTVDEALLLEMLKDAGEKDSLVDLTDQPATDRPAGYPLSRFDLASACTAPGGLAVAGRISRVFVACGNGELAALDPANRRTVATFPIDPTTDSVAYDSERGLLYAASYNGRLAIVERHVANDTYAAVLKLPVDSGARTLALNPNTGQVYLVTDTSAPDWLDWESKIGYVVRGGSLNGFRILVVGN